MNVINNLTVYTRYIPTRIVKGGSYLYAQLYYEAGEYGIMAIDPTTLAVLSTFSYNNDRISDICVYSDSRIAIRSDNTVAVLSFDGTIFTQVCKRTIRSSINTGIACNNDFVFVSCGSKIISVNISTGEIAQELNTPDYYTARAISCASDYLFVRETNISMTSYKLAAYRINSDYLTNPNRNLQFLHEIDSPGFDTDLGRLTVDASLNIIEPCIYSNRFITFNGTELTVMGDLTVGIEHTTYLPALEFIKHGDYYFISPNTTMKLYTLNTTTLELTEEYASISVSQMPTYVCPGFIPSQIYTTRDISGDGSGRNVSRKNITP